MTGGIGAGKSTVADLLARMGAVVVDADAIVRELQRPGTEVFDRIVERFGPSVVSADGTLDREALAARVFDDAAARADLDAIVHPAVGERIAATLTSYAHTDRVVVLDVPLLVETGGAEGMDLVVVVAADEQVRLERLVRDRGMRPEDVYKRIAAQASDEARLAQADVVIRNDGSRADVEEQVRALWERLEASP